MSEPVVNEGLATGRISPWMHEPDPVLIAALGKLAEESGELASRASRCIVQGLDELDPDTGRSNREELAREMADVDAAQLALITVAPVPYDITRRHSKFLGFTRWFDMIRERTKS